ncbi:DedA family protein [Fodinisporobacter ferrooxydans]|uniref:DedA family protein n=1 Tax=Fodinisporobacter ferrooxydans TaxID=2901836 RepID=A0ABY4CIE8_9BACL|nr:DedA family protein [Alicyclobacillaceae bacterium MYW30-H2]
MHFNIQHIIQQFGYWGIFFTLLLEMIGVPFPGETILTLSGIEWQQGTFSLLPLLLVTLAGNIIGSTISYMIGRYLGRSVILRFGKFVGITEQRFHSAEAKFQKYTGIVVFFGKFIAGIRVLTAYLAGINRMSFWLFSVYNAIGSLIWCVVFIMLGSYVEIAWQRYHLILHQLIVPILILIVAAAAIYIGKKRKKS